MAELPTYPDANGDTGVELDRGSPPGAPRWVKAFGIIVLVLVLLFGVAMIIGGGNHGPSRHMPSGNTRGGTPLSSEYEHTTRDRMTFEPAALWAWSNASAVETVTFVAPQG